MKIFTKEVKIALVAIAGVVILFFGMNFLKGLSLFSTSTDYYVDFKDVSGLSSSCPIYADGYKVGTVKDIVYGYGDAKPTKVLIAVDKEMRIPEGSSAEIVSDMMGNVKVNLLLANNPRSKVEPGGTIVGGISDGAMGQIAEMLPAVQAMLPKLDSILGSLNTLLADPEIAQSLHNVHTITGNLAVSTSQLNKLMGTLNNNAPALMAKANGVLDNTDKFTANLAALDLETTKHEIDQTLANVQQLTDKLNSNQGTLGLLVNDASLYNNLTATMRDADSLVVNLKQHPKRYVHFSLFGKKDK